jgi:hypothetical protein
VDQEEGALTATVPLASEELVDAVRVGRCHNDFHEMSLFTTHKQYIYVPLILENLPYKFGPY